MTEHQIYKWFLEATSKQLQLDTGAILSTVLSDNFRFEEFAKKALKNSKKGPKLKGFDGKGKSLDKGEI